MRSSIAVLAAMCVFGLEAVCQTPRHEWKPGDITKLKDLCIDTTLAAGERSVDVLSR